MAKDRIFKMRVTEEEEADLLQRAKALGPKKTKSDAVRRALGWDGEAPAAPDPDAEPGKTALAELAGRMKR